MATTSVSGSTGSSPAPAPAASAAPTVDWFNPKAFGAKGDGKADDTVALQAALDACAKTGGTVYISTGTYVFSKPLMLRSHTNIQGANSYSAILEYHGDLNQSWLQGTDMEHLVLRDLGINGTTWGSQPVGTGHAIDLTRSVNPDTHFVTMENVHVQNAGGSGIRVSNPMVSKLDRCVVTNCGRGFELYGVPGGMAGTSVKMAVCYANNCAREGYSLSKMTYMSLDGCAADHNGVGYHLFDCDGVALTGCGAELTAAKNGLDGTSFLVENSRGITITSAFTWSNAADAIRVGGGSQNITITGTVENGPTATATASIRVQPGSTVSLNSNTGVSPETLINK
jgi:hypothetical protein